MSARNMPIDEATVETLQIVGVLMEKAAAAYERQAALDAAIQARIPGVVEALVANGRIEAGEKAAAEKALRNPLQTLELLKFAAEHRVAGEDTLPARGVDLNGKPVGQTKTAAPRMQIVGGGHGMSQAELAFDEALGLR